VKLRSPCSGPNRAHREEPVHLRGGPLRAFRSAACKSCGPTQQPRVLARCVLDGPTRAICRILQSMKWACASGLVWLCSPCSGPIQAHRQGAVHLHGGPLRAFHSASILLSANHVGPCNNLMCYPVVCLIGQHELLACILQCMQSAHASNSLGSHPTNHRLCGPT